MIHLLDNFVVIVRDVITIREIIFAGYKQQSALVNLKYSKCWGLSTALTKSLKQVLSKQNRHSIS